MRSPNLAVAFSVAAVLGICSAPVAAALTADPAVATGDHDCRAVVVHTKPTDGTFTTGGKGKGFVKDGVVVLYTPVGDTQETKFSSWVRWTVNPDDDFRLKHLLAMEYRTLTLDDGDRGSAAPAVRLVLSNGVTLVYEPYWNGTLEVGESAGWQKWNVLENADWWDSPGPAEPAGGVVGAPTGADTFEKWVTQMGDAKVLEVNVGMGTYNEGAKAKFKGLTFKYKRKCDEPTPAPTTATPTATPTTPAATATASPGATTSTPVPPPGAGGGLPVTGPGVGLAGAGLLLVGAALFVVTLWRRRRTSFMVE
jgi:hypothetical protein